MLIVVIVLAVALILGLVVFGCMCMKQDSTCNDRHKKAMEHTKQCVKECVKEKHSHVCKNGKDGKDGKNGKDGVCPACPCTPPGIVSMVTTQAFSMNPDFCEVTALPWDDPVVRSPQWTFLPPDTIQLTNVSGEGRHDLEVSVELWSQTSCPTQQQPNGEANIGWIWLRLIPASGPDANVPLMIRGTMRAITAAASSQKRLYHMHTSIPVHLGDKLQTMLMVIHGDCVATVSNLSYNAPDSDATTAYADFVVSRTGCLDDIPLIVETEPSCPVL